MAEFFIFFLWNIYPLGIKGKKMKKNKWGILKKWNAHWRRCFIIHKCSAFCGGQKFCSVTSSPDAVEIFCPHFAFKIKFTLCLTMGKTHHGALTYTCKLQTTRVRYWEMEKLSGLFWGWVHACFKGWITDCVGNTDLDSGTPKCSKSLPLFFPQNWSLGSKGPGIFA